MIVSPSALLYGYWRRWWLLWNGCTLLDSSIEISSPPICVLLSPIQPRSFSLISASRGEWMEWLERREKVCVRRFHDGNGKVTPKREKSHFLGTLRYSSIASLSGQVSLSSYCNQKCCMMIGGCLSMGWSLVSCVYHLWESYRQSSLEAVRGEGSSAQYEDAAQSDGPKALGGSSIYSLLLISIIHRIRLFPEVSPLCTVDCRRLLVTPPHTILSLRIRQWEVWWRLISP